MARRIRKFVDRAFARTVDLDLLKRFLEPYQARIGFDWQGPYETEDDLREAVFELFCAADGRFPSKLQFALFNISTLSTDAGANLLVAHAHERGVALAPREACEGEQDGRRLNPRHLALLAYLDHRDIFDRALDAAAFLAHSSKHELSGRQEGVAPSEDAAAQRKFRDAISAYFVKRYQGRYCDVRWYSEDGIARALVLHGSRASTKNVDQDGEEDSLTYREIVQDTIEYDAERGMIAIGARCRSCGSPSFRFRMNAMCPTIEFSSGVWRLAQIVLRVEIETGATRNSSVTVKLRPATAASFRRQRFEGQIMKLLRRNGFCHARDADRPAVAAE